MPTTIRAALLALASWFGVLALFTFAAEPSRDVMVWVADARMAEMLSTAPVSVMDGRPGGFLRLRGDAPGFVRTLYASGAWIVLPAASGGCRAGLPG